MSLQQLLQHGRVWRGRGQACVSPDKAAAGIASGYHALDEALPFRGWPRGALTEILYQLPGQGELQLLLPALARLTHDKRYVVFIDPPALPYAPALSMAGMQLPFFVSVTCSNVPDRLWALEQTLRADDCGAVLAWPQQDLGNKALRRLQLAAEAGSSAGFLFRHTRYRSQHSPAALRLEIHPDETGIKLELFKCRGRRVSDTQIELPHGPLGV